MLSNFTAQRVTKSTTFATHVFCDFTPGFIFDATFVSQGSLLYINSTKASNISRENGWT